MDIQLSGLGAVLGTFFGMRQMAQKRKELDAAMAAAGDDPVEKMKVMGDHNPELYGNPQFVNAIGAAQEYKDKQAAIAQEQRAAAVQSERRRLFNEMNAAGGSFVDPMARAENVAIYGPLAGIDKDQMQAATKAIEGERGFGYDIAKEKLRQTGDVALEGVKQTNRLAENVQQLGLDKQKAAYSNALSVSGQKEMARFNDGIAQKRAAEAAKLPKALPEATRLQVLDDLSVGDAIDQYRGYVEKNNFPVSGESAATAETMLEEIRAKAAFKIFGANYTEQQKAQLDKIYPAHPKISLTGKDRKVWQGAYARKSKEFRNSAKAKAAGGVFTGTDEGPQ